MMDILERYLHTNISSILLKYKSDLGWIFLCSSFVNILILTPMLYMLQIFDRVFISQSELTLITISLVVLFYFISALSTYLRQRLSNSLGLKLENDLNESFFTHLLTES